MKTVLEKTDLGRKLLAWLEPYPVVLTRGRLAEKMPTSIQVGDGRLVFANDFESDGSTNWMFVHDVAHFLAAPDEDLLKPNIGLYTFKKGDPMCPTMTPELIELETEVFTWQGVLLRHFDHLENPAFGRSLRVAQVLFKLDSEEVMRRIETRTYDEALAEWERKIALVRETVSV